MPLTWKMKGFRGLQLIFSGLVGREGLENPPAVVIICSALPFYYNVIVI